MDQDDTWYGASLGLRDTVLDEDPAPPPLKGHSPQFSANVRCGQTAGWTKMPLGMEVGLVPGDFVFVCPELWFLATGSRHNEHIQMKFGL